MPSFLRCLVAAALGTTLALLAACSPQTPVPADTGATDEAAIRAASAEWAKVAAAKDLEKTLSYYADDASMFPSNLLIVTGPEQRMRALHGPA